MSHPPPSSNIPMNSPSGPPGPPGPPRPFGMPPAGFRPPLPPGGFIPPPGGFIPRPPPPGVGAVQGVGIRGVPPGLPVSKQVLNTVPSKTVYVSNLNEKIKLDALKKSLRNLFQQHGEVLDIIAHRNIRMRGQAFIAYPDEESAEKAIKELQHYNLFGKPMVVQFARTKSDVQAKKDGDYEEHYKTRMQKKEQVRLLPLPGSHKPTFKAPGTRNKDSRTGTQRNIIPDDYLPPNNILFLQNLTEKADQEYLIDLFQAYPGFKEVRMIPTKKSIAFVEYETDYQASLAKMELANHRISEDHLMKVTFARK